MMCQCGVQKRFPTKIKVNGSVRNVVAQDPKYANHLRMFDPQDNAYYYFYLDSEELPERACSEHCLTGKTLGLLVSGLWVFTDGNKYEFAE